VDRLGGFDETMGCAIDCDLWIRYSFHMPMVLQPEPLVLRGVPSSSLSKDSGQDARDWIRILAKVSREHPEFLQQHKRVYKKALSKNYRKHGRSLLARVRSDPTVLGEARRALRTACRVRWRPSYAHVYLCWSYIAASTYGRFRQLELDYFPLARHRSNPPLMTVRRPSLERTVVETASEPGRATE